MDILNLEKERFFVDGISAIRQSPTYTTLNVKNRSFNGLILLEKGKAVYDWDGGVAKIDPGSIIYLPEGSYHTLKILTDEITFLRLDFTVTDENNEKIVFSKTPMLITKHINPHIMDLTEELITYFGDAISNFKKASLLLEIFNEIKKTIYYGERKNIASVINYIETHYTENIDCFDLPEMSYLSTAQMYRQFKKETGETPISFRNKLRIERAKTLLLDMTFSISDISNLLGFENIFYFSRLFKKHEGVSPSIYRNNNSSES